MQCPAPQVGADTAARRVDDEVASAVAVEIVELSRRHRTALEGQQQGLNVNDIFLLHDAFYDLHGRALQPATDPL